MREDRNLHKADEEFEADSSNLDDRDGKGGSTEETVFFSDRIRY